jgi:anti-anti-sigma factor
VSDHPAVAFNTADGALICTFTGRLDTKTCTDLEADLLARVQEAGQPVVFDLGTVDYVASMFLRLCLQVSRWVGPDRFRISHVLPQVLRVFKIASLDSMIH